MLLAGVDVVLIGVFTMLGVKVGEQNEARKHMIAELAEANHRLEEMIAERGAPPVPPATSCGSCSGAAGFSADAVVAGNESEWR